MVLPSCIDTGSQGIIEKPMGFLRVMAFSSTMNRL